MKAKTLEGSEIDLSENTIESLKKCLQGPIIFPGGDGYDQSRRVWNGMIDRRPAFVIRCLGAADVIASVQFARSHGKLVRATNDENPDLFWGLQGGGWNFGVVTGIDFNVYTVGPEIVGGIVAWPAAEGLTLNGHGRHGLI